MYLIIAQYCPLLIAFTAYSVKHTACSFANCPFMHQASLLLSNALGLLVPVILPWYNYGYSLYRL
jgi:hypothetical protein